MAFLGSANSTVTKNKMTRNSSCFSVYFRISLCFFHLIMHSTDENPLQPIFWPRAINVGIKRCFWLRMGKFILPNFDLTKKKQKNNQKFSLTFSCYPLCLLKREEPMKNRLHWNIEKNSEDRTNNKEMNTKFSHICWASFCGTVESLPHKV